MIIIIYSDLLNGIVTLDKLYKYYKSSSNIGTEELFNTIIEHIQLLIDKQIYSVDEIIKLYTELLLSELINKEHTEADKSRINRKITQLLKEAVLNNLNNDNNKSITNSPIKVLHNKNETITNVKDKKIIIFDKTIPEQISTKNNTTNINKVKLF